VRTLLTNQKAEQARKLLQQYSLRHKPGPGIHELMAEIYSQLGQQAESHRFVAEYYYASGQTRAAIQQLRLAKSIAGDDRYVSAVIDERLKELREEELDRRKE
jgi:predicted Zn-dependent protease